MSVRHRLAAGFAVLLVLFLSLVFLQLVVDERLDARHADHAARIEAVRDLNRAALQYMTDAETGVRGFQLTGEKTYLEPYESGRAGAFAAFDGLAAAEPARSLIAAEREAATDWLYTYAIPIVNAGVPDADPSRAALGKELFDTVRTANAHVDAAVAAEQQSVTAADRHQENLAQLLFAGLAVAIVATGFGVAALYQRQLLAPVEHLRDTLGRLASGDHAARAVPAGPAEMRTLVGSLNHLAEETATLLAAEQARAARGELRQAVAAELRGRRDPAEAAARVAALIGEALGAEQVHARLAVRRGDEYTPSWPAGVRELDPDVVREIRAAETFEVHAVSSVRDAIGVALSGDSHCPPGVLCVVAPAGRPWTTEEHRLLAAVGREIDHAVRQQRLQLRQAHLISELRILDEQKDVFVSTVTHELRTPLTSILGYTEMLEDGALSEPQRRGVDAIVRNAHRLEATVGDLLLLNRSNDKVGPEAGTIDLAELAAEVHADLAQSARAKDLDTALVVEPARVRGDAAQLGRALRNLMENAIKFTPAGGRVRCRVGADGGRVIVVVTDTGIGIPAEDVPGLFTPFHRASNAMHLAVQGNGLGLAIVRNIVTEHGGSVVARSELDRGTTFTVTLPGAR